MPSTLPSIHGTFHILHEFWATLFDTRQLLNNQSLNFEHIIKMYTSSDPIISSSIIAVVFMLYSWVGSLITKNYSYVDRQWSFAPIVYCWNFAIVGGLNPRLVLIAVLSTIWGLRLSYNFYRKGGYSGKGEDYRWAELQAIIPPFLFQIFNLIFIAIYQHILLFCLTLPSYFVCYSVQNSSSRKHPLNFYDAIGAFLVLSFIFLETVADQQQWNFQTLKYKKKELGEKLEGDFAKGFLTTKLFRYSRHPNFFAEQALWCSFCIFSIAAAPQEGLINWSCTGAVQLILLFHGSTTFTEYISAKKVSRI